MREEKIHDALNLLDDDLIGEVEFLRSRKRSNSRKWMSWGAMAACMCIIAGSLYANLLGGMKHSESADAGASIGNLESMQETDIQYGSKDDSDKPVTAENEQIKDKVGQEESREVPSVLVEIIKWEAAGFKGIVTGIVDTDIYSIGTEVYVKMDESMMLADCNGTYPEGSVVRVQFYERDEDDRIILFAEQLERIETE